MHNEHTTDRMIASFLSRKAEEFPEIFHSTDSEPTTVAYPTVRFSSLTAK